MYIVYFEGSSMGKRFDDTTEMGAFIAEKLRRGKKIKGVELFV